MSGAEFDVLVIGAGPAGLTAAWELTRKSTLRVGILEADPVYVGGISRTQRYKGFLFDIGGHRFFSKSQEIERLWSEMLPGDFLQRPRKSRILYDRALYSYPLRAFEALRNLGLWESVRCVVSYGRARLLPTRQPRTFHEWVANQFGERLYSIFFRTYTEKVWGMSCDELSADWAAQRIKGLNLGAAMLDALIRSLGLSRAGGAPAGRDTVKTLIESFRYPRKGPGMLWESVATTVQESGARLFMGRQAVQFTRDEITGGWTVEVRRDDGTREVFRAVHVICSAPMRDVVGAVTPLPVCAAAARTLRYRDFITVALVLRDEGGLFDDNWIYIHDTQVRVGRIQNFASWSPDMIPQPGFACLGLEYFCFEGDSLWDSSDAELIGLATREIEALGLVSKDQVVDGCVVRQPKAYPVYDEGYRGVVDAVRAEFRERYPTLHFVGRNGMHKYNNQDHAMMTAVLTVENILAGRERFDVWGVNEDAEYHEELRPDRAQALEGEREVPQRAAR